MHNSVPLMVTIPFFDAEMHRHNGNEDDTGKNHTNAKCNLKWKGERGGGKK